MKAISEPRRVKPERITGIAHVFAAAGYSIGGLRRLWQETAFRHIVFASAASIVLLGIAGATFGDYCILFVLFFGLVAVEALNTAIECLVDHLTADWEEFARDAKDLGSLATMCLLIANAMFLISVVVRYFILS